MPRKRYKAEEIIAKLRQVDVLVSQSQSMAEHDPPEWREKLRSSLRVAPSLKCRPAYVDRLRRPRWRNLQI
jgi:hypothetical protein